MEKEKNVMTEPIYKSQQNINSKSIKKAKKNLTLPLIANISNLKRDNSENKENKNKMSPKRGIKRQINKKRMATERRLNIKKYKINKDLDLVYKLNMEIDVDQIFEDDFKLRKEREKIDNSQEVKAKRLNIFKNTTEKKDEKKIEIDSKEKEKYIEKDFKDELEKLEKIKNECNSINSQINEIRELLEEYKLELNVYNNYGDVLDKKFLEEIKEKTKIEKLASKEIIEQNEEDENDEENHENDNNNVNEGEIVSKKNIRNEKFEHMNAFSQMKRQREERLKTIKQDMLVEQEQLKTLEEKQNELIKQCKEKKIGIYKLRHQLLNIYHLNLYEGLNFRTDGLATLIRSIWNLGVNVDVNYMPPYLDNSSIDYLFEKTKRLIDISKMRQIIEENEKEFEESIKQWKQMNIDENSKDSDKGSESNFFQTGVMEKYNYLDKYPRSKQFMEEYDKKYFHKNEKFDINLKDKIEFKSRNIPYGIIEKYNNIEKLKYLLKKLIDQNDNKEKKEIERLSKEFINNEYGEKYQVAIETIMGALCGEEKKNEGISIYTKIQKEYREGKKVIQFHKNINRLNQK